MAYRQIENSDIGMFQIVESFLKGKHAETDNEDAIFINPAFAAVIDGATSKSDFRKDGMTTGQWAVQCVMERRTSCWNRLSQFLHAGVRPVPLSTVFVGKKSGK